MEQLKEMLFQLCSAAGTPGDEHFAALQAKKALEPYCYRCNHRPYGKCHWFYGR